MERKSCATCKSRYVRKDCEPCSSCRLSGKDHPNWESKDPSTYVELGPDVDSMRPTISEKRRAVIDAMIELARRYGCRLYVEQAYDFNNPALDLAFLENDEGRKTILALCFKLDEFKFKPYTHASSNLKLADNTIDMIAETLSEKLRYTGRVLENIDVNSLYPHKPNKEILRQLSNYTYGYKPSDGFRSKVTIIDEVHDYCKKDVEAVSDMYTFINAKGIYRTMRKPEIKKVIFNDPATIVMWDDGTKTVVKTQGDETFDPEKGLAMAISKKVLGNKGNYFEEFKKWIPEEKKEIESTVTGKISVAMDGSGLKDAFDAAIAEVKRMEESIARKTSESDDNNWKDGLIKYLQSI